ncbi:MAG: hypothetical protein HKN20_17495 [Gemmatimonadetes bacterium]|nr:hypothetical protein [Gemmatimonadota bacterium]
MSVTGMKRGRIRPLFTALLLFLGALATGCGNKPGDTPEKSAATDGEEASEPRVFVFDCDADRSFTAKITDNGERVIITLPDTRFALPRVRSASGEKFGDGITSFWTKGEEAELVLQDDTYRNCVSNPREAVWEEARLRGADFRATGNEPPWRLELFKRSRARFITGYDEAVYEFSSPETHQASVANATALRYTNDDHELIVEIRNELCSDSMSGARAGAAVFATFNGQRFTGCGRILRGPNKR